MKKILLVLSMSSLFLSCGERKMFRSPMPGFGFTSRERQIDEESMEYKMEMALLANEPEERYQKVKELLEAGANPNKKTGQFKWIDTNPLWSPRCIKDTDMLELFLSFGADAKRRPYLANCLSQQVISNKNPRKEYLDDQKRPLEDEIYYRCKLLLQAGADPNMKGQVGEKILLIATDWNYARYWKKHGTLPVNFCIIDNLITVFNLLVEYGAKLDEESLKLAEETTEHTGSSEMEELVKRQWERQSASAAHKRRPGK
ncbi:MAG: hypothetical protein K2J81_05255 [Treponemataceae bacterium]|nr:hypothetical protein [Treponemataceae bacterium]